MCESITTNIYCPEVCRIAGSGEAENYYNVLLSATKLMRFMSTITWTFIVEFTAEFEFVLR